MDCALLYILDLSWLGLRAVDPRVVRVQVGTNPKPKKPKPEEEPKSEEVVPKTSLDLLKETLPKLLSYAATARTQSISLSNVEYASELSQQLLKHAESMEQLFKRVQKATDNPVDDDKILTGLLDQVRSNEAFHEKAKAG